MGEWANSSEERQAPCSVPWTHSRPGLVGKNYFCSCLACQQGAQEEKRVLVDAQIQFWEQMGCGQHIHNNLRSWRLSYNKNIMKCLTGDVWRFTKVKEGFHKAFSAPASSFRFFFYAVTLRLAFSHSQQLPELQNLLRACTSIFSSYS